MFSDLGTRLVRAGLISRDQLAHALAATQLDGGILAARLIEQGLNEEALAGVFLGDGYGPLITIEELATAAPSAVERVPEEMARELLALPIRTTEQGLITAMADPTDPHLIHELSLAASMDVIPKVSFVSDLRVAIEHAYQQVDTARTDDGVRQVTHRPASWLRNHMQSSSWPADERPFPDEAQHSAKVPRAARAHGPTGTLRPPSVPGFADEHMFIPLAASHSGQRAPRGVSQRASASRPLTPSQHRPAADSFAPETTVSYNPPASVAEHSEIEARPQVSASERSWSDLLPEDGAAVSRHHARSTRAMPSNAQSVRRGSAIGERMRSFRPSEEPEPPSIGPTLASIRASRDSDQILRFACYGAASVAALAVALVLRKGTLEGREAAGVGVPREAIRKIWIPTETASVFQKVLATGESYMGPHGTHAADVLFRSATASRGPELLIEPIFLHGRIVAMLCADGPLYGNFGHERIRTLSYAVSEALARIIMSSKK
ncbi:MAG: hypothetical protein H6715_04160 [Myxococcales bacterium]|nr:hypothetical protein [Myxococcales bacterium]MCB9708602.1 hypothetical protein [Myxococcales bacterium]